MEQLQVIHDGYINVEVRETTAPRNRSVTRELFFEVSPV